MTFYMFFLFLPFFFFLVISNFFVLTFFSNLSCLIVKNSPHICMLHLCVPEDAGSPGRDCAIGNGMREVVCSINKENCDKIHPCFRPFFRRNVQRIFFYCTRSLISTVE